MSSIAQDTHWEDYCIIRMDVIWEARVDNTKLSLIYRESGVAPRQLVREDHLHDVSNECVSKVGLNFEG